MVEHLGHVIASKLILNRFSYLDHDGYSLLLKVLLPVPVTEVYHNKLARKAVLSIISQMVIIQRRSS